MRRNHVCRHVMGQRGPCQKLWEATTLPGPWSDLLGGVQMRRESWGPLQWNEWQKGLGGGELVNHARFQLDSLAAKSDLPCEWESPGVPPCSVKRTILAPHRSGKEREERLIWEEHEALDWPTEAARWNPLGILIPSSTQEWLNWDLAPGSGY